MVSHHPTPELLAGFSSGSLSLGQAMAISAHIEYCLECRLNVHSLTNIGGHMLESLTPQPGNDDAIKQRVLNQLDMPRPGMDRKCVEPGSEVPRCLQRLVGANYSGLTWRSITPSVKFINLCCDDSNATVSLLKIMPGAKVGRHGHLGEEITQVLKGSFSDERGIYHQGDFLLCDSEDQHNPIASNNEPCICLTVQEAPIQFTGLLTRVLNPFLRVSHRLGTIG